MIEKNWRELIKPKALEFEKESITESYTKFIAKPLERGFGLTLGNGLRRILLSSLKGASVTALKIHGAAHEFTALSGVKEDVVEIILNLKEVRFRLHTDSVILTIEKTGAGNVTAADIKLSDQVEVLNPDQVIATLQSGAEFKAEIKVSMGRGYLPAEDNKDSSLGIDWIPVDSFFSPVRRVNYTVTQSRVGQRTDYDKLALEVWTDGSLRPEDAISLAAMILKDQLTLFMNFDEDIISIDEERGEKSPQFNPNLYRSVEELELSVRSANCLQNANIKYIWELVMKTESEMLKTKNFGRKSLNEIKEILVEMGLHLGMKLEGFVPPTAGVARVTGDINSSADVANDDDSDFASVSNEEEDDEGDEL